MFQVTLLVMPIFIVLLAGNLLFRVKLIDSQFISVANRLVFYFLLPVLLFYKIAAADLKNFSLGFLLLIMCLSILLTFILSFMFSKSMKFPKESSGTFAMNSFRANYAYMGLPVSYYVFGETGLTVGSILMAFIVPVVNLMSVVALSVSSSKSVVPRTFLKNTLFNPLAVSCILGLAFSILEIKIPQFLNRSLELISNTTLPLALFGIGATLDLKKVKGNLKLIATNVFFKLLILPLLGFVMLKLFSENISIEAKILVIMLSSPAATVNFILASQMDGDTTLASSVIILSSGLSIFSYIFWITFMGGI